jgi:hypothetical protein
MIPVTDLGNLTSAASNPFMLLPSLSAVLIRVTEHTLSFLLQYYLSTVIKSFIRLELF